MSVIPLVVSLSGDFGITASKEFGIWTCHQMMTSEQVVWKWLVEWLSAD